jgi:hypothetical protein
MLDVAVDGVIAAPRTETVRAGRNRIGQVNVEERG